MKKSIFTNTYFLYTVSFLLLLPVVFYPFLAERKSFVWCVDGINQHLPILLYYGRMLRGLLTGAGFAMVDFTVGMGYDTITTLHYYVLGDPLALLSVFMNQENGTAFYTGLILLRLYLIGISFLLFGSYWKLSRRGRIPGALIYVFCGYTFYSGVRHPYFLNPMIYLPLLLIGLEEILRRRKPYLFIGMVFLSTISNFYFLFMLTVISVIYVMFRYLVTFARQDKHKLLGFLIMGLRIGSNYLLGMLMASVIFLPVVYAFFQNGRMDSKPECLISFLHYNMDYYKYTLQGVFASGVDAGYWMDLSFPTLTAVSFAILFCNKRYVKLKYSFLLIILGCTVPAFGYFMNGFAYITNRWCFLLPFAVALIVTTTYEELLHLGPWEKVLLLLGVLGYGVLSFAFYSKKIVKLSFCFLLITALLLLMLQQRQPKSKDTLRQVLLSLILFASIGFNGYAFYSAEFGGYAREFLTKKQVAKLFAGGEAAAISSLQDDGLFRIETFGDNIRNEALPIRFNDVSAYYSLLDGGITNYYKQLELLNQRAAFRIDNQDNRTILNAIAGVKYFVTSVKRAAPYGYELMKEINAGDRSYYLYRNKYALPIGYVYHDYLPEEEYGRLNALEKQNALLYAVILEEDSEFASISKRNMREGITQLDYRASTEGMILGKKQIKVKKAEAELRLFFEGKGETETYLQITGLSIEDNLLSMQTIHVQGEHEKHKNINIRNKHMNSYFGKVNFLANTGYSKDRKNWIRLTFPEAATYLYDSIRIYNVDMLQYRNRIQELGQEPLTNIKTGNNRLQGEIMMNRKGLLFLSIPYSKGWKAYVDGRETKLDRGNIMYMALPITEGKHQIRLQYRTPYLKEGALISILSFLCLMGMLLYERKNHLPESTNVLQ